LLLRGFCKGEPARELAAEVGLSYQTVLGLRYIIQAHAGATPLNTPRPDRQPETGERFDVPRR
jgi:hypothetical protein